MGLSLNPIFLGIRAYSFLGVASVFITGFRFFGEAKYLSLAIRYFVGMGEANVGFPYSK